ncbi:MAG: hypothetical protein ACOZCO_09055 [Bacteroidota bacterium]
MLKKLPYICIVLLCACGGSEKADHTVQDANNRETAKVAHQVPRTIANTIRISRCFSSPIVKDRFILSLTGENYPKSKLVFCILNQANDTLFYRQVNGLRLLEDRTTEKLDTEEDTVRYMQLRMSSFFAESNFSNPPYFFNDPTKEGFKGDLALWNEIKNDSTSWCFEFSLLEDGAAEVIAYSHEKNSVVVYDVSQ